MKRGNRIAAADRSFFAGLFASVAEEMGEALARSAHSPNIKERRDFSCAVFDASGRMIAQAAHIPVHLGAMPLSVEAALKRFGKLERGDVVIANDPYAGGTHLPDITLVSPVSAPGRGRAQAYLASRAHHADVGGMTPGSLPPSRDIYQEGLRIPPVKLVEAGRLAPAVFDILLANSRTPREREGDLHAQLAAHRTGANRLEEVLVNYGATEIGSRMGELLDYGRRLMEGLIRALPDGAYAFEDVLDGDGIHDRPLRIQVTVRIRGGTATVDFEGTDPACAGSVNTVEAVTRSAVYYCFLALLATPSRRHPVPLHDPPLNSGCFEPIRIKAPAGSLVNACPPSAVAAGNVETSQRIVDVVLGALSKAIPDIVPAASQGTMNNVTLGGIDPSGAPFAYYETIGGGMGARPDRAGVDGIQAHMTNTLNTPVEAVEYTYPMRVEAYAIATGTGGAGRRAGGDGIRRDLRVLCPTQATLITERRVSAPYGLQGGEDGAPGRNQLIRNGRARNLPAKCTLHLEANDILRIVTPGGGGYGGPEA